MSIMVCRRFGIASFAAAALMAAAIAFALPGVAYAGTGEGDASPDNLAAASVSSSASCAASNQQEGASNALGSGQAGGAGSEVPGFGSVALEAGSPVAEGGATQAADGQTGADASAVADGQGEDGAPQAGEPLSGARREEPEAVSQSSQPEQAAQADQGAQPAQANQANQANQGSQANQSVQSAQAAQVSQVPSATLKARAHIQGKGWKQGVRKATSSATKTGVVKVGTTGRGLRLEAVRLQLGKGSPKGSIQYRVHIQNKGWSKWRKNGQLAGTVGKGLRIEAVQIRLKGDISKVYEVAYRAHVQNIGWQNWVSGGTLAGTTGRRLRIEALQIALIARSSAPTPRQTVADGLYMLNANAATGYSVGVASASNSAGANVGLFSGARWRLEEKWRVVWKGDGYELVNANSGKVLEAKGGAKSMVANVHQAKRTNAKNQRWAIVPASGGGYTIVGMNFGTALNVQGARLANGTNIHLWPASSGKAQRFDFTATAPLYEGTYQVFTKLAQNSRCADVPNGSVANNAQLAISAKNDGPNQHFVFAAKGGSFTIQAVSSGKFLTGSGAKVVQLSAKGGKDQLWDVSVAGNGGLVFRNAETGKVLSVQGNSKASGTKLQQIGQDNLAGQRWYLVSRPLVSTGLYELRTAPASAIVLDVAGGSISSGANAAVAKRNGGNNQKFVVVAVKGGYYRIGMPFGSTVVTVKGASQANGANVRMEKWRKAASQLWNPVVTDGGLVFVNKKSGKALSFAKASSGKNVCQSTRSDSALQKWSVVKTSLNPNDLLSYRMFVRAASGAGNVRLSNKVPGYSISKRNWNRLISALNYCYSGGFDVGFLMMDASTGMTVSLKADKNFYGASTIKGLYVTYLFEEYLEKGRLSWGAISGLANPAIANSDNDAYYSLRARFGSEGGFATWLGKVGVGHIGTYGTYSARTLALAWTHMLSYAQSDGRYVGTWKSLFNHSYFSVIRETLGGYRAVYSKPGWMPQGSQYGSITNDGALVYGSGGRKYVLAIMSSADPFSSDKGRLGRLAAALDAIHAEMPGSR